MFSEEGKIFVGGRVPECMRPFPTSDSTLVPIIVKDERNQEVFFRDIAAGDSFALAIDRNDLFHMIVSFLIVLLKNHSFIHSFSYSFKLHLESGDLWGWGENQNGISYFVLFFCCFFITLTNFLTDLLNWLL